MLVRLRLTIISEALIILCSENGSREGQNFLDRLSVIQNNLECQN